ncbi:MAG TPA: hypothetical protein VHA33_09445 [Candidatus Angelobacter sp.]|jgi:hypothetical protein|nr:hypothetical protein [Candidatus Angelobacter sp.]
MSTPDSNKPIQFLLERPWILLLTGIAIIVTTVLLRRQLTSISHEIVIDVLRELGMALAIIGFVTWSVEAARVKSFADSLSSQVDRIIKTFSATLSSEVSRKLDEIKNTTVDAVIQGPLPRAYYEHVQKVVFKNCFVRETWDVTFNFEWNPTKETDKPDFVYLAIEQIYRIRNVGTSAEPYEIDHYETRDWDDIFPGATDYTHLRAELDDQPGVFVFNESVTSGAWEADGDQLRLHKKAEIKPGQALTVTVGSRKIMRDRQYESRLVGEPTLGVNFHMQAPEDLFVEVEIPESLLGSLKEKIKPLEELKVKNRISRHWNIPFPLPPSACIFVSWRHRKNQNEESNEATKS